MTKPVRISRRLALAGGAAAALTAGNGFAQPIPPLPPPDEDVLFEHEIVGHPFPRIAFGPVSVASLEQQLTQLKADRDFAQGKTDLTAVDALIRSAEPLVAQAGSKQPAPLLESPRAGVFIRKLGPFALSREGRQAGALLRAAQAQLAAALPGVLPSQAQRVGHELTMAHKLIAESAAVARNDADATDLAAQAQGLYKQAYDAYQAGQYDKAAAHGRAALATAEAARAAVEPEPIKPNTAPAAPPPPTF